MEWPSRTTLARLASNGWVRVGAIIATIATLIIILLHISDAMDSLSSLWAKAVSLWPLLATPWLGLFILALVAGMMWYGIRQVERAIAREANVAQSSEEATKRDREEIVASVKASLVPKFEMVDLIGQYVTAVTEAQTSQEWLVESRKELAKFEELIPTPDNPNLRSGGAEFQPQFEATFHMLNPVPPWLDSKEIRNVPIPEFHMPPAIRGTDGVVAAADNEPFVRAANAYVETARARLRTIEEFCVSKGRAMEARARDLKSRAG